MNDLPDPPLDQTEREMLGRGREVTYNYRCSRCRHEDAVPDVVIAGFVASAGLHARADAPSGLPGVRRALAGGG